MHTSSVIIPFSSLHALSLAKSFSIVLKARSSVFAIYIKSQTDVRGTVSIKLSVTVASQDEI